MQVMPAKPWKSNRLIVDPKNSTVSGLTGEFFRVRLEKRLANAGGINQAISFVLWIAVEYTE
jgi:hypothetical protein